MGYHTLLLICDFKDDFEFDWHPEWKTGYADYGSNRYSPDPKYISEQI